MYNFLKRLMDIVGALIGIIILSPVLAVVALVVRGDGGPALYTQERVGLNGKTYKIFKFRSMVLNAAKLGTYKTLVGDPRITRVGRFIRKYSLDELPQLVNVLRGEMSLVGPRPNVPEQITEYELKNWQLRNSVKPGITGLAQVSGRSLASFEDRLSNDLNYVKDKSILLDIKILLATVLAVIGKGSY